MNSIHLHPLCCQPDNTGLLIIDIQEAFRKAVLEFERVAHNAAVLARGFSLLGLPVLATEQYPKGLGKTDERVHRSCTRWNLIEKTCFSCTAAKGFMEKIQALGIENLVVCGIESHVCVNQTVLGLLQGSYTVHIAVDTMASRNRADHETALRKMEQAGAVPTTTEMCLFELVKEAGTEQFKQIQKLIK